MMRPGLLASTLLFLATSACDEVDALGPDAGTDAMVAGDAGGPGAAPVVAPMAVVAQDLPTAPALIELTELSGQLGLVVGRGAGTAHGRIDVLATDEAGATRLRRAHRATDGDAVTVGQVVTLIEDSGARCAATVTRLVEVAAFVPDPAHGRRSKATLWRIALERDAVTVVAELASPCAAPIAADESNDDRVATAPVDADQDSPVAVDALARLRALPRFAAAQAAYRAEPYNYDPDRPDWSEGADTRVTEFVLAGRAYVTAALERTGWCGDFGAAMFAVWQRQPDGALRLILDTDAQPAGYDLAFDVDHDGVPELASLPQSETVYETIEDEGCAC